MKFFHHFTRNEHGRDFAVGDIHGCYEQLDMLLQDASFDEEHDRLFSVGDLVDRGPDSAAALKWLAKPWFHAVRGNHDQMVIDADLKMIDASLHVMNGGDWWYELDEDTKRALGKRFAQLPIAIEIETATGLVGIVHAEPVGDDWAKFVGMLLGPYDEGVLFEATWNRDRIRYRITDSVKNVDRIYVGHTPVQTPVELGNMYYIDTGAVFGKGRKMTLVDITLGTVWQR